MNFRLFLNDLRSGDNILVGETFIAASKASNGIAPGVLADLAARSNTASFVGGLYQRRSEVGDQHLFTDEVVTYVSPGLTQEIRLAAGSVPRSDLNWVLVSDSSLALGSGVVINGQLRIVSGILPHSFTFPRMRPSKYVVPFVPNAQSRGGGTGFLVAQSGTPDLLRTELLHLMELIRSEHEEDSQTVLNLQSAAEFSRNYSQSALALGAMLLGMIVVALVVYLGLLVGLQFNRIQPRRRVMLMLGADVRNLTAQFVGPLCLVALAGSIVGLPLAQAGVWWLREQSPWMIEWPSTAQLAVATLVSMIAFQFVVLVLGWGLSAGMASHRPNWAGPIASFSLRLVPFEPLSRFGC